MRINLLMSLKQSKTIFEIFKLFCFSSVSNVRASEKNCVVSVLFQLLVLHQLCGELNTRHIKADTFSFLPSTF